MSKAEERAFERYPDYKEMDGGYVTQIHKRKVFAKGYQQAEKDLELTWMDIEKIDDITLRLDTSEESRGMSIQEFYQEVLNRFKERK